MKSNLRFEFQENLAGTKQEVTNLKEALQKSHEFIHMATAMFRSNMTSIKSDLQSEKDLLSNDSVNIYKALEEIQQSFHLSECQKIQRLTVDHELELIDLKNLAIAKDDEIRALKLEKIDSECIYNKRWEEVTAKYNESELKLKQYLIKCEELEKQLELKQVEHESHIQEIQQEMQREHHNEIESLRSRFRHMIVTNMKRSPSESSLEHESIIAGLKETLAQDQQKAVKDALEEAELAFNVKLELEKTKFQEAKSLVMRDAVKKVRDEKDKQIEALVAREEALSRECRKYRDVIQQLADEEEDRRLEPDPNQALLNKIDELQQENCRLEAELSMERSRRLAESTAESETLSGFRMGASMFGCNLM